MVLKTVLNGNVYKFKDLKELFGKANEEKSGDAILGIAAKTVSERIAAKVVLSQLTLEQVRNNPLISPELDEVSKLIEDDVNETIYSKIKSMTFSELREHLLKHTTKGTDIAWIREGLTAEMIAGVTKLMSNMDLVYAASKIRVMAKCKEVIGERGTLSFRCQPNHPMDDIKGITASLYEGLSYGSGDACFGVNPVEDNVENTTRTLNVLYDVMEKFKVPTQIVVLSHITTQTEAVRKGAPCSMIFQSLAGTEKANKEFGINKETIDEAYSVIKKYGIADGPNLMYFETGQGSEQSLSCDLGVDELTLEARTYAFAKHWKPFMVNNVSGFIGPETLYDGRQMIRANLEDHFMGKLTGLPMGMAPCYTNHTQIDQNDQEIATMLLALAGSNYYMGVPCGDDIMLSYQDTSYFDDATLRELIHATPAKSFFKWTKEMGILDEDGCLTKYAGDASMFA